jgi:hypothetical protein
MLIMRLLLNVREPNKVGPYYLDESSSSMLGSVGFSLRTPNESGVAGELLPLSFVGETDRQDVIVVLGSTARRSRSM